MGARTAWGTAWRAGFGAICLAGASLVPVKAVAQAVLTPDAEWLTWGHDVQRTGSNPGEKVLGRDNVAQLEVKWATQIATPAKGYILSTMTAP